MLSSNSWIRRSILALCAFGLFGLAACTSNSNAAEDDVQSSRESDVAAEPASSDDKPARIGEGQRVDLAEHAVEGKITIFDFYSDYCPPCVQISPWLDRLHKERDDIEVVKIDVNRPGVRGIDWRSPTLAQFGIRSIPHFKVYGADGEMMSEGKPAYEQIVGWLRDLPQQGR